MGKDPLTLNMGSHAAGFFSAIITAIVLRATVLNASRISLAEAFAEPENAYYPLPEAEAFADPENAYALPEAEALAEPETAYALPEAEAFAEPENGYPLPEAEALAEPETAYAFPEAEAFAEPENAYPLPEAEALAEQETAYAIPEAEAFAEPEAAPFVHAIDPEPSTVAVSVKESEGEYPEVVKELHPRFIQYPKRPYLPGVYTSMPSDFFD